jgi:hypothetical protein
MTSFPEQGGIVREVMLHGLRRKLKDLFFAPIPRSGDQDG